MDVNSNKQFVLTTVNSCVWLSPVAPPLLVPAPLLRPLGVLFQTIKSTFYHNQINIFQAATLLLPKRSISGHEMCVMATSDNSGNLVYTSPPQLQTKVWYTSLLSKKPLKLPMHPC